MMRTPKPNFLNNIPPRREEYKEYSVKEAILLARKYNLETEIRMELSAGLSPTEALEEWDVI